MELGTKEINNVPFRRPGYKSSNQLTYQVTEQNASQVSNESPTYQLTRPVTYQVMTKVTTEWIDMCQPITDWPTTWPTNQRLMNWTTKLSTKWWPIRHTEWIAMWSNEYQLTHHLINKSTEQPNYVGTQWWPKWHIEWTTMQSTGWPLTKQLTSQSIHPLSDQPTNQPFVQPLYQSITRKLGDRLIEWLCNQTNNRPSSLPRKQPSYLSIYISINPFLICTFVIEFTNIRLSFKYWVSKYA